MNILALDFGGTRMRAAWYTFHDGALTQQTRVETATQATDPRDTVIQRLITLGRQVIPAGAGPDAVGIAAPGPHEAATGVIHHSFTLPGWHAVPLGDILRQAFGCPVYMQNDGNLGALAEYHNGAGRGCNPLLYMTISTGIGGGVILNGQLFTGWSGLAAEPGHVMVTTPEGERVRLEAIASGTAIGDRAQRLLASTTVESTLRTVPIIDGAAVGHAAQQGDAFALSVIRTAGEYLGLGMVSLLHLFSPEAMVIGGSVAKLGDLLFEPAREVINAHILNSRFIPPNLIRPAQHGENVCLIGAAWWAAQKSGQTAR